jgi:predicted transcriptional regulator
MNRTVPAEIVDDAPDPASKFMQLMQGQGNIGVGGRLGIDRVLESRFRLITAAKMDQLKKEQAKLQEQLEEIVQQIEDWLEADSEKRAKGYQAKQTAAFETLGYDGGTVEYAITTTVCTPPERKGKKRKEPKEYECYTIAIRVTTSSKAVDTWSGSIVVGNGLKYKLNATAIRRLQRRDEIQEGLEAVAAQMRQLRVDEASMIDRLKLVADEKMTLQLLNEMPELAEALEATVAEVTTDPLLMKMVGAENLKRLEDTSS